MRLSRDRRAEGLVHRDEEEDADAVLDRRLVAVHLEVDEAEDDREEGRHHVLEDERRLVASELAPRAARQQRERDEEARGARARRRLAELRERRAAHERILRGVVRLVGNPGSSTSSFFISCSTSEFER